MRDNWAKVVDMHNAVHMDSIEEATGSLITTLDELRVSKSDGVASKEEGDEFYNFNNKDLILYALGGT